MVHVKNFETMYKFVKVMRKKLQTLFSRYCASKSNGIRALAQQYSSLYCHCVSEKTHQLWNGI